MSPAVSFVSSPAFPAAGAEIFRPRRGLESVRHAPNRTPFALSLALGILPERRIYSGTLSFFLGSPQLAGRGKHSPDRVALRFAGEGRTAQPSAARSWATLRSGDIGEQHAVASQVTKESISGQAGSPRKRVGRRVSTTSPFTRSTRQAAAQGLEVMASASSVPRKWRAAPSSAA